MKNILIQTRNILIRAIYKGILKPILFMFDPEDVHDHIIKIGNYLGKYKLTRKITSCLFNYNNSKLEQNILGITFRNPIGLAAGFDKNGELTQILGSVGFGFAEIGSITGEVCNGNPKPRLWRLKKSRSLAVNYGLKNDGAEILSKKLLDRKFDIPIGINIAKTNSIETVDDKVGIEDYFKTYNLFSDQGSFVVINISCPNAYGGQPFTDENRLNLLLAKLSSIPKRKPVFIKISPDITKENLENIIELAYIYKLDGFICTNLTKNRKNKKILDKEVPQVGGLSGKVVEDLSLQSIKYIYKKISTEEKYKNKFIIIGLGGVFCASDVFEKIKAGASLVELITGMIYEGPELISEINYELVKLLDKNGFNNIKEAIGKDSD